MTIIIRVWLEAFSPATRTMRLRASDWPMQVRLHCGAENLTEVQLFFIFGDVVTSLKLMRRLCSV